MAVVTEMLEAGSCFSGAPWKFQPGAAQESHGMRRLDKDWEDIPSFIYAWLSLNVRWQIMRPGGFIFLVRSRPIFQSFHPSHFGETLGDRVYIKWVVTLSPRKDHVRGGLAWGKQLCFGLFSSSFACILLIVSINICYKIDQDCFHF